MDSGLIDGEAVAADGSYIPANVSKESWIDIEIEVEQSMQSYLDSLDEERSNQPGFKKPPGPILDGTLRCGQQGFFDGSRVERTLVFSKLYKNLKLFKKELCRFARSFTMRIE